jgi:hypothetical protein
VKIKALVPVVIIGFVVAFTYHLIAIAAIDAPHNESNNVSCGSCHGQGVLESVFWSGSGTYDRICTDKCHTQPFCPYTELYAPAMKTHEDSDENQLAECRTCHDPHYQKQKNYKNTDADNLYLASGIITSYHYDSPPEPPPGEPEDVGTSTLTYSSIIYKTETGWDATRLTGKTEDCRHTILFPNVKKLGFSYPIIAVDETTPTTGTITVKGDARPVYQYISPPTDFMVVYGQYIRDIINDKPVKFFDSEGENSFADGDTTYNGVCEICHTDTKYHKNDGNGEPHLEGTRCTECHNHSGGLEPSGDCIGCHSYSIRGRAAIRKQFNDNSHHVQGVTLENTHCYECHWEAKADGSINNPYHEGYNTDTGSFVSGQKVDLVIYGDGERPTTYTEGTTAIQYMADGSRIEIGELNAHCLSCHSDQNNDIAPFLDGKTPNQYAWDNESIKIKYSDTGTTTWGKYAGTKRAAKQITKAYSAHGKAVLNSGGWDSSSGVDGTIPDTRAGLTNIACFDCHNSHGSSVSGSIDKPTTSYAINGGILKDTESGKGGYSVAYKPEVGGSAEHKNSYAAGAGLCFDCHMNANEGSTPWGYNSTFGATEPIKGYYDRDYFDFSSGAPGAKQRFAYRMGVSGTGGGHFGVSSALSSTPTSPVSGLCTPCHDPHGVSTTLNKEYAVPLLKGTWLTSPYEDDKPPSVKRAGTERTDMGREGVKYNIDQNTFGSGITDDTLPGIQETDSTFAGLCLRCHSKESLTDGTNGSTWKGVDRIHESVKGWGANVKHNYPCSKCHAPHSSGLPRLMVTNCLDSQHKGRLGYNEAPVVSGSGSGGKGRSCIGMCEEFYVHRGNPTDHKGNGYGRIPGSFYSTYLYAQFGELHDVTCHENQNPGNTDHSWNEKTVWFEELPFITSGPEAGSFKAVGADIQATITWTTKDNSTSYVDYGFTPAYGSTEEDSTLVKTHSITLTGLENHRTYHYKVKSSSDGGTTWSESDDHTFYISLPPTVPVYIPEPDTECLSSCAFILEWNTSSDPDVGPIEYYVEVDDISTFSSAAFSSGWNAENSEEYNYCAGGICRWETPALPSPNTWYWRVKARDGDHTEAVSDWSSIDSFLTYIDLPLVPVIEESFEESKSDGDGYDIAPWTPIVGSNCTLDPDAALPGTPPVDSGYQCLQSISVAGAGGYQAYSTLDYGAELPRTFTRVYLYLQNESLSWGDKKDIGAFLDKNDSNVFQLRLRRQAADGQLQFGLRRFWSNGASYQDYWVDISLNRWYKVEIIYDYTGFHWEWRLDGERQDQGNPVIYGAGTGIQKWVLGFSGSQYETGTIYFDMLRVYNDMPTDPPPAPELQPEPDVESIDPVSVILDWDSVTCPDGDDADYYVQIDEASNFNSPNYISGWLSKVDANCSEITGKCSWPTPELPTGKTWYWRVLARDSVHTDAISQWSDFDSFTIYPPPPPAPILIEPINDVDITSILDIVPVELKWGSVTCPDGDDVQYFVEVRNEDSSLTYSKGWLSGVTSTIIPLQTGNTWHWKVKARDEVHVNAESDWSGEESFKLSLPPMPVPVLIHAPNVMSPTPNEPVSVTLNWYPVTCPDGDLAEYQVIIDNDPLFGSPNETSDWILNTSYTTGLLQSNKTWYWKVMARDSVHQYSKSDWSAVESFKVTPNLPPPAPTLSNEADFDGSITGYDIKLEWESAVDPDDHDVQYYVEVYDNPNYTGTPVHHTTDWISGTSFNITVEPCTEWWWRVKARDASNITQESGWSSGDSFADILGEDCLAFFTPTAPILADEPDNECTGWCYVTVNWSFSTSGGYGPIEYKVQVKTEGTSWTNSEYASGWFTARDWWTTTDTIGANANQTWWWRVQARDSNHPEAVSYALEDSFRVVPTGNTTRSPSIPYPKVEPDQECTAPCPVTLEWYASTNPSGGVQYQVYVDDNSNFSSLEFNSGWISDTSYEIIVRPHNDVTLYWKVRARDAGDINDVTNFSGVDSFKVTQPPDSPPLAPILKTESDFNSDFVTDVKLEWYPETDPDGHSVDYYVELADNSDFISTSPYTKHTLGWTSESELCDVSTCSWTINNIETCKEWFWRVKARDAFDYAESLSWSDVDFFIDISGSCTSYYTPSVPVLINEPNNNSTTVKLEWYLSTGEGIGPFDYRVYVDDDSDFTLPIAHDSLWISGSDLCDETKCSWSFTSTNNHKWYWKVRARDPNHSNVTSEWSDYDFFWVLSPGSAPPAPTLNDEHNFDSGGTDTEIILEWIPETDPDGHNVDYYVVLYDDPSFQDPPVDESGWLSETDANCDATKCSWPVTVGSCTQWFWMVKARDAFDLLESGLSDADYFRDSNSSCTYTIIDESFEKNFGIDGTRYDEPWTETQSWGSTVNADFPVPVPAPSGSGSECLRSISGSWGYEAYSTRDFGVEEPETTTTFYIYVGTEALADNSPKDIVLLEDKDGLLVAFFRLYKGAAGNLKFRLRLYNNDTSTNYTSSVISTTTWYKIKIKYDNINNEWGWWIEDELQDCGNGSELGILGGDHRSGIQKWHFGFRDIDQKQEGTVYFDLINVTVNE